MCIDSSNKILMDQSSRLSAMMWLSIVMTVLLNLWEEIGEPRENEHPLFSKQPYSSSTWEVYKRWWVLCCDERLCSWPPSWAMRRIDRIERISCLESPKSSTSSAPPFKQPLDSNRKSPTVSPSSINQRQLQPFVFSIILAWIPVIKWGSHVI